MKSKAIIGAVSLAIIASTIVAPSTGIISSIENPTTITAHAAYVAPQKTYGDFKYVVNSDNTVTIAKYTGTECQVIIPEKIDNKIVTAIGASAFENNHQLFTLELNSNISAIGENAFKNCVDLRTINYMIDKETTIAIGSSAFEGCENLCDIDRRFFNSIGTISTAAFKNCVNLDSDVELEKATIIGHNAFQNCNQIKSITFGENLRTIGQYAFNGCRNLESIDTYFNENTIAIGSYAFDGCTGLLHVDSDFFMNIESISTAAFRNCKNLDFGTNGLSLREIKIIGHNAFQNCNRLTSIEFGEKLTTIGQYAFNGCNDLMKIEYHGHYSDNSIAIGSSAFEGCENLYEVSDEFFYSINTFGTAAFKDCTNLDARSIGFANATIIGHNAFQNCRHICDVTFGDNLTSIGKYAFNGCGNLQTIEYRNEKDTTFAIGEGAFENCISLHSVSENFFESTNSIGKAAFKNCEALYLDNLHLNNVSVINHEAFLNCNRIHSVTFSNNLKTIGQSAFKGSEIYKIDYESNGPSNLIAIGSNAFEGCKDLHKIDDGFIHNISTISTAAFKDCINLNTNLELYNITIIGHNAFQNCAGIDELTLGDKISSIGQYAFNGCNRLNNIKLESDYNGDTRIAIGAYAFDGCKELSSANREFFKAIKTISTAAFRNCVNLQSDDMCLYNVTVIGHYAFQNCDSIYDIELGENLSSVGRYAFNGCDNLEKVTWHADKSDVTIAAAAFPAKCEHIYE